MRVMLLWPTGNYAAGSMIEVLREQLGLSPSTCPGGKWWILIPGLVSYRQQCVDECCYCSEQPQQKEFYRGDSRCPRQHDVIPALLYCRMAGLLLGGHIPPWHEGFYCFEGLFCMILCQFYMTRADEYLNTKVEDSAASTRGHTIKI